jgi:hypothetical protein
VQSVRRAISQCPLWDLPRWLQVLVVGVLTVYCGATCASVAATRLQASHLRVFVILLACSAAAIELTRRIGEPAGVVRDVYAIWDLPAAALLPPMYALLAPIPRMVLTQVRVRQTLLYRRAYTAAAVGLAYAAASLAFHSVVPVLGPDAGTGAGERALLWTLLAAGSGLLRLAVNDGLVLAAVKGSAPETRLVPEITGAEALYGNVAELSLGTLSAFAAVHSTLHPAATAAPAPAPGEDGAAAGPGWHDCGPGVAEESADSYYHEGAVSRTWVASEAPRGTVRSGVLRGLLEPSPLVPRKRVTLLYRPLGPAAAARAVETDRRTAHFMAASSAGLVNARASAAVRAAEQAATEEAAGAGLTEFTLLVTATADTVSGLRTADAEVANLAASARLRLRVARGQQAGAFAVTLPGGVLPWLPGLISGRLRFPS